MIKAVLKFIPVLFFFGITGSSIAQTYSIENLSVPRYNGNLTTTALIEQIRAAANDTSKVTLMLTLCSTYWNRGHDRDIDSLISIAVQVRQLCADLRFTPGAKQADFFLCRAYIESKNLDKAVEIMQKAELAQRIRLSLLLGEHYMYLSDASKESLTKAFTYFKSSYQLSQTRKELYKWKYKSLEALGKCYFADEQYSKGRASFLSAIADLHRSGDRAGEASVWAEIGRYTPNVEKNYNDRVQGFERSIAIYHELDLKQEEANSLEDMAVMNLESRHYDLGETQALAYIEMLKALGVKKRSTAYLMLAEANYGKGNFDRALFYVQEALSNMELTGYKTREGQAYLYLGDIYAQLGDHANSLKFYQLALDLRGTQLGYIVITWRNIAEQMVLNGKAAEAIVFLNTMNRKFPPIQTDDKEIVASALGDVYLALKQYKQAERYYQAMIALDKRNEQFRDRNLHYNLSVYGSEAYHKIARFYFLRGNYALSRSYLNSALSARNYSPVILKDIRLLQFKLDSAAGDNTSALVHFRMYSALKDSLFTTARSNQLAALQVKYDIGQKQKNIKLLEQQSVIQRQQLVQSNQAKTSRLLVIGLLIVILGIGYSRFRLKQQANRRLEADQLSINAKNEKLEQLLDKQQHLLKEKEWLLKEVHHRVKNNLQLVISLLNSQSEFLSDDTALKAVTESQNRVQAMSLIHQRLYKSNDVSNVYMPEYIRDLVDHLKSSFKTGHSIYFNFELDPIHLDVGQAIPVTLILNELVSNAIKHAFPATEADEVMIRLKEFKDDLVIMSVSDNGRGFPDKFDLDTNKSFGLTLIRGLTDELNGQLTFDTIGNTFISLFFKRSKPGFESEENA